jgi:hypothetical protein
MAKSNLELLRDLAKAATASPAFDMEAFNRDNPVIEGKEFEPLSEVSKKPKKIATSKRVANADAQASKMKSTAKKAFDPSWRGGNCPTCNTQMKVGNAPGTNICPRCPQSTPPKLGTTKSVKKSFKVNKRKGIFSALSPHEEMKAKRGERAERQSLDPKKMTFADATVHLNSGKLRNAGWNPPAIANQKRDSGIKRDFHHLLRQTSHNKPMPLPKSFVISIDKQLKKAKSFFPGKLHKADIGYIEKHYSGKYCAKCHDPLKESNADIHSATFGERHFKGAICKSCASKMRD